MPRKTTTDTDPNPSMDFAHRVDLLAANQVFRLEKQITRRLEELCGYEKKLTKIEEELDHFIEDYYTQVGDLCESLTAMESELAHYRAEPAAPSHQSLKATQAEWKKSDQAAESKARKQLYRRLVKDCHPDVSSQPDATQTRFMQVQDAYETGSMAALWQMEWELLSQEIRTLDTSERIQKMFRWFHEMESYGMELTDRYRERRESPAAELLERYMDARLSGKDWMGSVKKRLESQLEQTKQTLVTTKIRTLYLEGK